MTDEVLDFQFPKRTQTIIKVIGVGGGGGNAVNHMYNEGIHDVSFALCNTDNQALSQSPVQTRVQLGRRTTEGLGAGNRPEVAKSAAEESRKDIEELLSDGTKMVFITAGMGGGTGTGAAPVVARIAKDMDILTVGIVTIPFVFEGRKKIIQALKGVEEIAKNVDALLVINNERLIDIYSDLTIPNAFAKADDTLAVAAKGIAEIITVHGHINLDFADVQTILKDGGVAIMSSGYGEGESRVDEAIKNALHSPLLNNNNVFEAKKILFNIYSGTDNPLIVEEMDAVSDFMKRFGPEIEVIWGTATEKSLEAQVKITLLATGFGMSSIPGIDDHFRELTEEEERLEEERQMKEEEEKRRINAMIEQHYGKDGVKTMDVRSFFTPKPIVLSTEELDDDRIVEALENNPVYKRDEDFNPAEYKPEQKRQPGNLFGES
ncbi:cell division protein FtsZ [Dysgonomonas sp. PH5-45]|uniref:cell division protein FtsZ n=1 Tax=unclassified Dysgonomonas TaxID=2630389 RepID=UPI00247538BE|nr:MULTISPECIES: cell division protein FtsZ [unclassified Dysgonomonas]MDH6355723.1 cell division protein FtsZ [Dysgonomonas sp. PH5-45]MDH6388620.1 cell division protein FtsZ [Dysgonomonas sp. PH5-37]